MADRHSAINIDHPPRHVTARRRGECDDGAGNLDGIADTAQRIAVQDEVAEFGLVQMGLDAVQLDERRGYTIDRDAVWREFHRMLLHQHQQAALRAAIGGIAAPAQGKLGPNGKQMNMPAFRIGCYLNAHAYFCVDDADIHRFRPITATMCLAQTLIVGRSYFIDAREAQ